MYSQAISKLIGLTANTIIETRPELRGEVNSLLRAFGVAPISTALMEEKKPAVTRTRTGKITVESSVIDSVEYVPGRLTVTFNSGAVYNYYAVPRKIFNDLLLADSVGEFYSEHVRGCFSSKKVRGPFED